MSKFQIGDEVVATKRCRERWPMNDFGDGTGKVIESEWYKPKSKEAVVAWNGSKGGAYVYATHLLELACLQENE